MPGEALVGKWGRGGLLITVLWTVVGIDVVFVGICKCMHMAVQHDAYVYCCQVHTA